VNKNVSLYKVFGCRAFALIPKQARRKSLAASAIQGIFIGLDKSSCPGYMIYSPEFHTTYVTGDAVFHANKRHDASYAKHQAGKTAKQCDKLPVEGVERFKYLVGTSHIDPENGLLYKVLRVEEKNYRGQGTFIVTYRAQVMPDGRASTKCDNDNDASASEVDPLLSSSGRRATLRSSGGASADAPVTKRARVASLTTCGGALPLFYEGDMSEQSWVRDSAWCHMAEDSDDYVRSSSGELDMLIDSVMYGDPLVEHCLATGAAIAPIDPEPNKIKQAYSSPERDKWREAVEVILEMIRQFNVLSDPLPLPKGAIPLNCRWVFKRKRDHLGNVIKHKARLTPQGCFQHFGVDYLDFDYVHSQCEKEEGV